MHVEPVTQAGEDLLSRLRPALVGGNLGQALETVRERWSVPELIALLKHSQVDIRKVAALALGLVGGKAAVGPLAVALHDGDPMMVQMAEHALWSVWFRLGKRATIPLLKQGSCHLNHGNYDIAVQKFTQAIEVDPGFAEAYNQRAIAHYLAEEYRPSIADSRAALERMPHHFGAMAGMGHCYAHLHEWAEARRCYRLALTMHPQAEGIAQALAQVEAILRDRGAES